MFRLLKQLRHGLPAAALIVLLVAVSPAQDQARRLILKDGSYQSVTKYEVKGDRVRYYSSEREEWEELPNSLVDWPATEKYEKDRVANASAPEAVLLDKELQQQSDREEAQLPLVAPGLRLPENSGVFLLDNFEGQPQIVELQQTAGDINRDTKTNIFRGALNPIAGLKVTIELDRPHATLQAHVPVPSLYINVDAGSGQPAQAESKTESASTPQAPQQLAVSERFRVIRTEVKGSKRIVGDVKRQVTGKVSQEQHFVKTTITGINGGWLKITPTESLSSGEYVLVEMMGKEGMNLYVWDFGINPKAPANANPWKPEAKPVAAPSAKPDQ